MVRAGVMWLCVCGLGVLAIGFPVLSTDRFNEDCISSFDPPLKQTPRLGIYFPSLLSPRCSSSSPRCSPSMSPSRRRPPRPLHSSQRTTCSPASLGARKTPRTGVRRSVICNHRRSTDPDRNIPKAPTAPSLPAHPRRRRLAPQRLDNVSKVQPAPLPAHSSETPSPPPRTRRAPR